MRKLKKEKLQKSNKLASQFNSCNENAGLYTEVKKIETVEASSC